MIATDCHHNIGIIKLGRLWAISQFVIWLQPVAACLVTGISSREPPLPEEAPLTPFYVPSHVINFYKLSVLVTICLRPGTVLTNSIVCMSSSSASKGQPWSELQEREVGLLNMKFVPSNSFSPVMKNLHMVVIT